MEKSLDLRSDSYPRGQCLGVDRISFLPKDILWFILSFLTSKEVVQTSLVSRRWMDLWVQTPILDLHRPYAAIYKKSDEERRDYVEWVNCVLQRHKGRYLEEFKIGFDLDINNQEDIDKWLVFAFEKKVQRLELNLRRYRYAADNYVFPSRLLNLNCGIGLPQFDLKCFKSLSLDRVDVTGEAINFILQDCPFLERLKVVDTGKLVDLVISNPTLVLKYLQIKDCSDLKVISISNFNLVSLEIQKVWDLTLTDIPELVELSLFGRFSSMLSVCLSRASSCLSQLQALSFEIYYLKDVTEVSNLDQLTNLKRLVIAGLVFINDESLTELISVMNSCPQLEEFVLKPRWDRPKRSKRAICEVKRDSRSSSLERKRLKVFEFLGYYGRVSDVELVMHVLEEYGSSLEKIIIDPRDIQRVIQPSFRLKVEQEARSCALKQFEDLRESIPQHVQLVIC